LIEDFILGVVASNLNSSIQALQIESTILRDVGERQREASLKSGYSTCKRPFLVNHRELNWSSTANTQAS
jgi:hypothetical protein